MNIIRVETSEEIKEEHLTYPRMTLKDLLYYFAIVAVIFVIFMWVGNFGNYLNPVSPISEDIGNLYKVTYILAGVIFSLFEGAIVYFVIKFWDRGKGR
jgi:hypothetical protein